MDFVFCPSYLRIIRVSSKIQKSDWIEKADWNYLNSSINYPYCKLSSETENLFTRLLKTLNKYVKCLYNIKFDHKNNKEMIFVTDVLLWL
ncbi:hypothetical protein C1645_832316 [Glomus cerebriforme]|uniref:Uncharacterized protein n=1 Tax=Glomus cerebriforme TaxID=658196 RepID=A0A397SK94_9GLOM|nr:hypothetical protein C1645_832316 [Glomus cerebriforme]